MSAGGLRILPSTQMIPRPIQPLHDMRSALSERAAIALMKPVVLPELSNMRRESHIYRAPVSCATRSAAPRHNDCIDQPHQFCSPRPAQKLLSCPSRSAISTSHTPFRPGNSRQPPPCFARCSCRASCELQRASRSARLPALQRYTADCAGAALRGQHR